MFFIPNGKVKFITSTQWLHAIWDLKSVRQFHHILQSQK